MKKAQLLVGLAASTFLVSVDSTATEPVAEHADTPPIEEFLVTGQQPGPGLWRVTRPGVDDRELWIFGNYSPLPKKMRWRSTELEELLRSTDEVLAPPSVNASVGPLGGVTLLPSLVGVRKNPNGERLADLLPPELYLRWVPLKARYLDRNADVEQWRPIFAAQALYAAALERQGLEPYEGVWPQVEKLARRARVRVTTPKLEFKVTQPRAAIREFKSAPLDDVDCFERTLRRLESDLDLMRDRSNAWSVGDVPRLRRLAPVERASACIGVLLESSLARERGYDTLLDRARSAWVDEVERALRENDVTLAVISVDLLLRPDGPLAELRRRGYSVDEP
jgi:hypothetical protein